MPNPIDIARWEVTGTREGSDEPVSVRVSATHRDDAILYAQQKFKLNGTKARMVDPPSRAGSLAIVCFVGAGLFLFFGLFWLSQGGQVGQGIAAVCFTLAWFSVLAGFFSIFIHALHRIARSINRLREAVERSDRGDGV
ncbi:MAG: hypothetical protein WD294_05585 [Phycisphaeraceae bacterium]